MLGDGGVFAIPAAAHVHGDTLASQENLDAAGSEPGFDLAAREAVRDGVMMPLDRDMVIEPDAAAAPFGMNPRLCRQRLEVWNTDFVEQLAARLAKLAQHALIIEIGKAFGDHRPLHMLQISGASSMTYWSSGKPTHSMDGWHRHLRAPSHPSLTASCAI